jgi:Ni,Fe-hydrogenase III large subunit
MEMYGLASATAMLAVAIELATLTTVLMVGIYRTHEALEAAWKYFILGSVGIAMALFGTILVYMAARPVLGEGQDAMVWTALIEKASAFAPDLLNVAFVFLMLGYGTKVGLAPLHAWLPDAHAEGPTPISAVLSGLLLNVALYALLRFKMLLTANAAAYAPGPLMVTLGLVSLIFAGFMLYRRRDIKCARVDVQRPWPRVVVDEATWRDAVVGIAAREATLTGLWSDGEAVHLGLMQEARGELVVLSLPCRGRRFPSVGLTHPPALRLERAIGDLYGLEPEGCPDARRWLDHGRWGLRHPHGDRLAAAPDGDRYEFLASKGPPMHQIPVGPVHAGIIEPGHFRFTANGETVVRLEERLGYVHKGITHLMAGAPLERAAKLAGRISGDCTVAYSLAFARAVEAALGVEPRSRVVRLRALMAELERIANHLGDIGAICNDASFCLMHAHCGVLREHVLRTADTCFGHRLMMDRIVPGGIACGISERGIATIRTLIRTIRRHFPNLIELYDNTASLQDRTVNTGVLSPDLALRYGAGGYIGRASARAFDARKTPGYAPYDNLKFDVPVRAAGDVDTRVWVRVDEVRQSIRLMEQLLDHLAGPP